MKQVVCVGQIVADVLVRPVEVVDYAVDTVCVDEIRTAGGGDAMNVAVNLGHLGEAVRFVGRKGQDGFGDFLRRQLEQAGVLADSLITDSVLPSSSTIVLINSQGERTFLHCAGANSAFCESDVKDEWLQEAGLVYIGGTFLLPGMDGRGTECLLDRAKKAGALTAMDVTHDPAGRWMETIKGSLSRLDYFLPSIAQARMITGCEEPESIAAVLLAAGVKTVVIKLGAKGCYVRQGDEGFYQEAYPAEAVDTTGAGDAFVAGFLSGVMRGYPLRRCVQMACASGSAAVCTVGATSEALNSELLNLIITKGEQINGCKQ